MLLCPCGSQNPYENCCGLYLEKKQQPQTPEQLMRSRYTAYSLRRMDYIKSTMRGKPLVGFNESETLQQTKSVTWIGLEVIHADPATSDTGFVEFKARFLERNQVKTIHELSEFHKENNCWYYTDGVNKLPATKINNLPIARNSNCPCNSGKKFKNCHAK